MEKKQFYLPQEDRFVLDTIENNNKNNGANNTKANNTTYKIDRKKRTEKWLSTLAKYRSKQEIDELRRIIESVSDEEFENMCKRADAITNIITGDYNYDFNR